MLLSRDLPRFPSPSTDRKNILRESTDFPVGSGTRSTYYTLTRDKFSATSYPLRALFRHRIRGPCYYQEIGCDFRVGTLFEIRIRVGQVLRAVVGNWLRDPVLFTRNWPRNLSPSNVRNQTFEITSAVPTPTSALRPVPCYY